MLKEFKEFIMRGSVIDMAIGIVIGGAFATIVTSFVDDILMPPVGMLLGGADFKDLFITLGSGSYDTLVEAQEAGAATINYGLFINNVISFLIIAAAVFLVIKAVNRMKRQEDEAAAEPTTKECPECLSEIPIGAHRCAFCTAVLEAPNG